jgi:hypothetical protein
MQETSKEKISSHKKNNKNTFENNASYQVAYQLLMVLVTAYKKHTLQIINNNTICFIVFLDSKLPKYFISISIILHLLQGVSNLFC